MASEENRANRRKLCPACKKEFAGTLVVCPHDKTMLMNVKEDELIGTVLNERYVITSEIGRGGMSIVYKGIQQPMDRTVAIKMLQAQLVSDQISIKRFQQEAQAASHLQHPNVITIYDYGVVATGQPYLVMDYLEGESLADIIKRDNHVSTDRVVPIFVQACEALEHAHQKGVIHRDLKSSNIMLIDFEGRRDFVKVVDFGIAKLMPSSGKQSQNLTQTGEIFGSPIYMSPEQCMGQALDPRSDIYSMGAMMYESLSGLPPLMGDTIIDTMQMHVSTPPQPFSKIRPDLPVPEALEKIVMKALAKKPEQRYQSMQEFRDALAHVQKMHQSALKQEAISPGRGNLGSPKSTRSGVPSASRTPANMGQRPDSIDFSRTPLFEPDGDAGTVQAQVRSSDKVPRFSEKLQKPAEKLTPAPDRDRDRDRDRDHRDRDEIEPKREEKKTILRTGAEDIRKKISPVLITVVSLLVAGVISIIAIALTQGKSMSFFATSQEIEGSILSYQPVTPSTPETAAKPGRLRVLTLEKKTVPLMLPPEFNIESYLGRPDDIKPGARWKFTCSTGTPPQVKTATVQEGMQDFDGRYAFDFIVQHFYKMASKQTEVAYEEFSQTYKGSQTLEAFQDACSKPFKKPEEILNVPSQCGRIIKEGPDGIEIAFDGSYFVEGDPQYLVFTLIKDGTAWKIEKEDPITKEKWDEI